MGSFLSESAKEASYLNQANGISKNRPSSLTLFIASKKHKKKYVFQIMWQPSGRHLTGHAHQESFLKAFKGCASATMRKDTHEAGHDAQRPTQATRKPSMLIRSVADLHPCEAGSFLCSSGRHLEGLQGVGIGLDAQRHIQLPENHWEKA